MKLTPAGLFSALLGLLCCVSVAAPPVAAQDARTFKVLKLAGHQVRWQPPANGASRVITYGLVTEKEAFPAARNCRALTGVEELQAKSGLSPRAVREELAAAFAMWEAVANVSFTEVAPGAPADILVGAQVEPEGWAFADVFFDATSPETVKPISKALVCLNPVKRWKVGFDGDLTRYDLRYTLAHEIGHAIGLDHPAGGGDQVMGYRYDERFRTLQPGDTHGARLLYGPPSTALVDAGPQRSQPAQAATTPPVGRALGK